MDKILFETIYNNLKSRVEWCDINLGPITKKEDLENLSASSYIKIKNKCKEYLADMDKIYTELNHIYGMGNLTVRQQSQLYSIMKKFTNYRSDIKCLATHSDPNTLPSIPKSREYDLTVLAKCKLKQKARGAEGVEPITTYVADNPSRYYSYLNGNKDKIKIEVKLGDQASQDDIRHQFALCMGSKNQGKKFTNKMQTGGTANGIIWSVLGGVSSTVLCKSEPSQLIFFEHYQKLLES